MESPQKVMHVDDDEDILEIARIALEVVDTFTLSQFSSPEKALDAAALEAPDLLLLDFMMPTMTGLELWKRIRGLPDCSGVPAVFMTAKAETYLSEELKNEGALEVITKPFDPMMLGLQLREAWQVRG